VKNLENLTQEVSENIEDRLESIFSLQKGLANMMNLERYPKDVEGRIAALCTAIIHEAVELQRTTNWKWWKKPIQFNEAEAREELIDIWHFVVQASLELNLSPDDILTEYKRKNEINRNRQKNGY
jgi:dimeric dUTPase (all-alpha-NTP-PPase superfamily)